jgi:hypothetical protein
MLQSSTNIFTECIKIIEIQLENTRQALDALGGVTDCQTYWDESGHQRVRSAGVFLTSQQQARLVKQLNRLAAAVRQNHPDLQTFTQDAISQRVEHHQRLFDDYLATYR